MPDDLQWLAEHADLAESDGCPEEAARLRAIGADLKRLRALVKDAEWAARVGPDGDPACRWCGEWQLTGATHAPDCPAFHPDGDPR